QRLVSIDALFALGDGLNEMAQGKKVDTDALVALAGSLREFEMPRPLFTTRERTEWASGLYNVRHTTMQMRTDLAKVIQPPGSRADLAAARGQLTPFLRDTLVGFNYAYYEPPGAQVLHNNPLFVRSQEQGIIVEHLRSGRLVVRIIETHECVAQKRSQLATRRRQVGPRTRRLEDLGQVGSHLHGGMPDIVEPGGPFGSLARGKEGSRHFKLSQTPRQSNQGIGVDFLSLRHFVQTISQCKQRVDRHKPL